MNTHDTETPRSFADLGVSGPIVAALSDHGITEAFPIQALTLPVALKGADIIGQAKTGTGKTLGFGIPLIERVDLERLGDRVPQALVVVPTRELANQVAQDLIVASEKTDIRVAKIYGGRDMNEQIEALKNGVDVVVGTPGRLLDLYNRKVLVLNRVVTAVLDEADEMLDLGFLPDIERIFAALPAARQTMLFSATMPGPIMSLARRYMSHPTHIQAHDPLDDSQTVSTTTQFIYRAHPMDKSELVARLLQAEGRGRTIIFARTKRTADRLAEELRDRGFNARPMHGDLQQVAREKALKGFRDGRIDILVCTDVAARGIDVKDVTHVVNYQCPDDDKTYVHRVGRTGRAGSTGIAVTLVDWEDIHRWKLINRALGLNFEEPVETYSTSPHLYSDLGIPEGTKGRLKSHENFGEKTDVEPAERSRGRSRGPRRTEDSRGESRSGARNPGRSRRRPQTPAEPKADHGAEVPADTHTEDPTPATKRRSRTRRRTKRGAPTSGEAQGSN